MSKEKRWRTVLAGRGGGPAGGGTAAGPAPSRALHTATPLAPPQARWRFWPFSAGSARHRHRPVREEDLKFLDAVRAAQQVHARPGANAALYLIVVGVAAIASWAATTQVEQITRTDARVVPESREQVISSLEGGILRELLVREGAKVSAGQPLARLDPTRFESQQSEGASRVLSLKATFARLKAEADGRPLDFPDEVMRETKLLNAETDAYIARRRLLAEAIGANQTSIALVQRELNVAQHMSERGLMSDVEVMRLRRQINDMRQQSLERANRFRQEASTELLKVQAELAQLEEQMVAREDVVKRTVLNSPVDGLVKNIRANTLGGVVGPGAPIMEIVPKTARLLVEAKVKPADIGFVRVGQTATMKLSAYEFNLYGGLSGTVESISPDALGEADKPGGGPDATWFRALVSIDASTLQAQGKELPVIPGMTGTVEINTGQRSVLDFVLRPLLKAKEAFRER